MTPDQARALRTLGAASWGLDAETFARSMWPDSLSWSATERPGQGICYAARVMLNRMIDDGWVHRVDSEPANYTVTTLGLGALQAHRHAQARAKSARVHQAKRPCGSSLGIAKRTWKDVTCPACLRHRPRGASSTTARPPNTSRTQTRKRRKR